MRDNIILYKNHSLNNSPCISCRMTDHDLFECQSIRYLPDKELTIKRFQHQRKLFEKSFKRGSGVAWHALGNAQKLTEIRNRLEEQYDLAEYENEINKLRNFSPTHKGKSGESTEFPRPNGESSRTLSSLSENAMEMSGSRPISKKGEPFHSLDIKIDPEANSSNGQHSPLNSRSGSILINLVSPETARGEKEIILNLKNQIYDGNNGSLNEIRAAAFQSKKGENHRVGSQKTAIFIPNRLQGSQINNNNKRMSLLNSAVYFGYSFDIGRNFKMYYPHNNMQRVLAKFMSRCFEQNIVPDIKKEEIVIDSFQRNSSGRRRFKTIKYDSNI